MKKQFLTLVAVLILFVPTTGFCFPPCADKAAKSLEETLTWNNCFGRLQFGKGRFEGDIYVGEFRNGKGHGYGSYTWSYKDSYIGEFKNGLAHGRGIFTNALGKSYKGIFGNGQFLQP